MSKGARQYVFEGMELLPEALIPFVERRLKGALGEEWRAEAVARVWGLERGADGTLSWDQGALLRAIDRFWAEAFRPVLRRADRSIAIELVEVRNGLAHNDAFRDADAERALDSMRRLVEAVGADAVAARLGSMRDEILRSRFAERNETGESASGRRTRACAGGDTGLRWRFAREQFERELIRMLDEERAAGKTSCRVVARDLHRRVVGGGKPNRMPMACKAMWELWRKQGSEEARIVRTTRSGQSTTIEIEYRL